MDANNAKLLQMQHGKRAMINRVILGSKTIVYNYYCIRRTFPEYHLITPARKLVELNGFD